MGLFNCFKKDHKKNYYCVWEKCPISRYDCKYCRYGSSDGKYCKYITGCHGVPVPTINEATVKDQWCPDRKEYVTNFFCRKCWAGSADGTMCKYGGWHDIEMK